ncbi:unnamed protein product, partial [Mesorhabditis belari]|uniref:Uncharacterized protein n=1 Tax=Mesorhabditis belari TaxID=2138241 RepID=A0AAF3ESM4_9BILA
MTTAHRPTFNAARGGTARSEGDLSKLSAQYSSKDMPSHLKIKHRQTGQATEEDLKRRDLRRELEDREHAAAREKRTGKEASSVGSSSKKPRFEEIAASTKDIDADEPLDEINDSDEDSDDDDTAALMEELARIKKERAAEREAKEERDNEEQEKIRMDNILQGNPLLNFEKDQTEEGFKVKRRWDDDVVFKNCAKGIDERKKEATFINDAIRSEFHRKFMDKYIK